MADPFSDRLSAGERLAVSSARDVAPRPQPSRAVRRRSRIWRAWRGLKGAALAVIVLGLVGGGTTGVVLYERVSADLPDVRGLQNYQPRVMSRVYAGDSRLLAELATERRIFVPSTAIPDLVKRAFLAAEDQNFFIHAGVDPLAILRAAVTDILQYGQGRRPVGASTITQQVAKNMLLGNEVSLSRKLREALLAIRIEKTLSKDRILELYLNEIYLGAGAYGVAAAAETYFDKPLAALTPAEAAFLAALPKAPNNYNPQRFPEAARARRDWVVDRMIETHALTPAEAAVAKAQPVVPPIGRRPDVVAHAEYFAEDVRRVLGERFGADASTGGLSVRTTLDPDMQAAADRALRDGLVRYDQKKAGWRGPVTHVSLPDGGRGDWPGVLAGVPRPPGMPVEWQLAAVLDSKGAQAVLGVADRGGARTVTLSLNDAAWARPARQDGTTGAAPRRIDEVVKPGDVVMVELAPGSGTSGAAGAEHALLRQIPTVQGALVSLDPATGRVLALSGGWSFEASQFNRATQAQRQPGSSFKPIVYLAAMQQDISPSQHFLDAPVVVDNGSAGRWRPGNYEGDFNGPVPLHVALEKSLNLVTIRVAERVGMAAVAATAKALGEVDDMPRVLPAALGAVETTVLREAGAYATIAAGGRLVTPTLIDSVQDRDGHVVWRPPGLACEGCDDAAHPPRLVDTRAQVADPQSAFQVVMMMEGVVQHGTGVPAAAGIGREIAGKTGTSQDFNDAWFGGFTPDLVTVVWVGFDTPQSLGENETGGHIAAPIWHDFMQTVLKARPALKFTPPPGLTIASYDGGFGTVTDAFKPGQVPGASSGGSQGGGEAASDAGGGGAGSGMAAGTAAAGVDSGLGGLY